jgi:hypothetical protein
VTILSLDILKVEPSLLGQLCLFSLLHTLICRKDLRNELHDTTMALPTVSIHAPDTPSADSRGHRFSRDSSRGVKSVGDTGDLSFHSAATRATQLYEDSTIWATERKGNVAGKGEPVNANATNLEAAYMNQAPHECIQSTGDIRHHNDAQITKRVWRQADGSTSLPGAFDLFLWETKPNSKGIPPLPTSVVVSTLTASYRQ